MYMGIIQFRLGNRSLGFENLHKSISGELKNNDHRRLADSYSAISGFFKETKQLDSCIFYAKKGLGEGQAIGYQKSILINSNLLAELFEQKDVHQALCYHKIAKAANDELYGIKRIQALQKSMADEQERQREIETERIAKENRLTLYSLFAGLGMVLLIASILYRNNRQKQKANIILEKTLSTLKSTRAQLIQSEKLASLGELTAGIAHEIQNPLNFVNNFSELSVELAADLKEEIKKPEKDWELIDDLTSDLSQNQEKINHHGKRAASIVKGMLEHSKASTGKKELTDINALVDEYTRLAYSNLCSKDNNSTVALETHFDDSLPKTEVIPQDIGRVLLNLMNNAFWAVKTVEKPLVTIKTQKAGNQIIIKVSDNGTGMSDATKAKVFQPFFTTKPTGQGTGLGLSLAYDIVTKGHGGTIEVLSVDGGNPDSIGKGVGSEFIIMLPWIQV